MTRRAPRCPAHCDGKLNCWREAPTQLSGLGGGSAAAPLKLRPLTDKRSITLPLCVLGAGAVHGLCVAAMLPMLITLPGPGGSAPPAIDVELLQPAPSIALPSITDPATTSALPKVNEAPATAKVEPSSAEVPPDDMPQQIAPPAASSPLANLPAAEPLPATLVMSPALEPRAPEEVRQVAVEFDADTTSSILPVAMDPATETLSEMAAEPSAPPAPVSEKPEPAPEPQPDIARADPKEETPPQAAPAEEPIEAEAPTSPPVAEPVTPKKPASPATARQKSRPRQRLRPSPRWRRARNRHGQASRPADPPRGEEAADASKPRHHVVLRRGIEAASRHRRQHGRKTPRGAPMIRRRCFRA